MNWGTLEQFLQMGGYGLYVWGSVAAAGVLLGGEMVALRARRQAALQRVARRARHAARRDADAGAR